MTRGVAKVPQVMQMEALECGAACLTMILAYYGRWVPLEQVRVECGVSRDGSKAANILRAARRYGLEAKGMTYSTNALSKKGSFPCIVFWNFNHYVVLAGFKGKYAYINDPARGQIRISREEFDQSFTGVVLRFAKTDAFEEGGERPSPLRSIKRRLSGMGSSISFVMLTAAASSLLTIVLAATSRVFLDHVLLGENPDWLVPLISFMVFMAVLLGIVSIMNAVYLTSIQGKIAVVSSSRFMRHLLHLPMGFYAQRMVGDLQQRQNANETIAFQLIGQLAPVLVNAAMLVIYLVVMVRYNPLLAAVGVSIAIANALVARYISQKRVNIARSMTMDNGKLYATTVSGIDMIETIKSAGAESGYFKRWSGYQANVSDGEARLNRINEYLGAIPMALIELCNISVLVLGLWLIVHQRFTAGSLITFQGLLSAFMQPMMQFIGLGQTVQEMETQIERVDDVMRYKPDVPEEPEDLVEPGETGQQKLRGSVDMEGICFGYSPLEPPLIDDFDLHLSPGKWVALVGGSGSGKSTVANLLAGLYQPWSGEIRFDGVPASEVPRAVMRSSLAVVNQDITIFDGTVSDNVKLWDRSIEDYEVIMACRDAGLHELINSREGGYSTPVLPGGRNFSGGQLQRLEIARVLAQDPTIVVLDEATSALDAQTEADVIGRIKDREITCVVVAHRLSTIRDCDEIVVLEQGKVVERGTHDELLALDGTYAQLVRSD